jgi:hypothetical protein
MIELPFLMDAGPAEFEIDVERLDDLAPGRHPGLDCICDGILKGTPFVTDPLQPPAPRKRTLAAALFGR